MRLINKGSTPRYSGLSHSQIRPGGMSRDLTLFSDFVEKFNKDTSGFEVVMSDKDIRLLAELCRKHIFPKLDDESIREASGASAMRAEALDPGGIVSLRERAMERSRLIQRKRSEEMRSYESREAKIRAESNEVDELGRPVPKADALAAQRIKDVVPQIHEKPGNDLKSVIENNLAVMRTASGAPIKDLQPRVSKGGVQVSSDPRDYPKTPAGAVSK